MKKNSTKFLVMLLILTLCFLCTACGGDSESTGNSTTSHTDDLNDGQGGDLSGSDDAAANDFSMYEGRWAGNADNLYDAMYIEIDSEGYWRLYQSGELLDDGFLAYDTEMDYIYADAVKDSVIDGGLVELEGDQLYIGGLGYFTYTISEDDTYDYGDGDSGVYHQDISMFEGIWYYDNDLSAETFIIIDGYGNWGFYQRTTGDSEATEMDYGTFTYALEESGTYYAYSSIYDNVRYQMYDQDEDVILWSGDSYYRIEDDWYNDDWYNDESIHIDFNGFWEYPDGAIIQVDDNVWYLYEDGEYELVAWGLVDYDGEIAYLMNSDGSSGVGSIYIDENGDTVESGLVLTYIVE